MNKYRKIFPDKGTEFTNQKLSQKRKVNFKYDHMLLV